jgi:hypothetical protein
MRPTFFSLVAWVLVLSTSQAVRAAENGPWLNALSTAYVIVDMQSGDLDSDGRDETAVCYRESLDGTGRSSGIVILRGKAGEARPVFHAVLDAVQCEKVRIQGKKLGILVEGAGQIGKRQLIWSYGDEIKFNNDRGGFLDGARFESSSSIGGHKANAAFDGDLRTSWAEGADGTGIGQTLTIRFSKPTDVAAIAIFPGNAGAGEAFFDHNRVHRASLETKSDADLGDSAAGVDFSTLGIDAIGDRLEVSFENRPQVTYVQVNRKAVMQIQVRVESVYLGDRRDETHIAEIEVVPLLGLSQTIDRSTPAKPRETEKNVVEGKRSESAPRTADAEAARADRAMRSLDESGRSLIADDQL